MRILQLAPRLPYPLTDGGAIGIYKPTEAIARLGHEITFVTYPDPDPAVTKEALSRMSTFADVRLVSRPLPSRNATLVRTIFKGAYPIERRMMPEMYELLRSILAERTFDLVHVDACHMGKYGQWIKREYHLPILLREHNFETLIYRRFAANARNPLAKLVASVHAGRMLKEETAIIAGHDLTIAITPEDETEMRRYVPKAHYRLIPAGVDTDYFHPQPIDMEEDSILWVGGMGWEPNHDAVTFFAKEIYPQIVEHFPKIGFDIVGDGTDRLTELSAPTAGSIRLHGRVPDVRPYLARAKVLVCPLRVGGGMRLKLLDFFAAAKAVVSTHIGAEGNKGTDGTHILLRDDADSFAQAVMQLLGDPSERVRIATNARALAVEEYSWDHIAHEFENAYRDVVHTQA